MSKFKCGLNVTCQLQKVVLKTENIPFPSIPTPKMVLLSYLALDPKFSHASHFDKLLKTLESPQEKIAESENAKGLAGNPIEAPDPASIVKKEVFEKWADKPKVDAHKAWRDLFTFY